MKRQAKVLYATQATNGSWVLYFELNNDGIERAYQRQTFDSENAALLFGAMNTKLLK